MCPRRLIFCAVKVSMLALSAHARIAALKLVKVGLSVYLSFSFFFAAAVASLATLSLPVMPWCPGHHLKVIFMPGARLWSSLIISDASIL